MKLRDLPKSSYFVVINLDGESRLLVKGADEQLRFASDYSPINFEIKEDVEVQKVQIK